MGLAEHREADGAGLVDLGYCLQCFHVGSYGRHRSHTGTDNQSTHSRQNRSKKNRPVKRNSVDNLLGPDYDRHEYLGEQKHIFAKCQEDRTLFLCLRIYTACEKSIPRSILHRERIIIIFF